MSLKNKPTLCYKWLQLWASAGFFLKTEITQNERLAVRAGFNTVFRQHLFWCGNVHNPRTQVFILATSFAVRHDLDGTHQKLIKSKKRQISPPLLFLELSTALHCVNEKIFFLQSFFLHFYSYIYTKDYKYIL